MKATSDAQPVEIVRVLENPADELERKALAKDRVESSSISRWVMYFTGAMAFIGLLQLFLFRWQLRLMQRSIVDTANSAAAAMSAARASEMNARAAIGMELPVIRLRPADLLRTSQLIPKTGSYGGVVNDGAPTRFSAIGMMLFENHGRTPAFPLTLSVGWTVATVLPPVPTYPDAVKLNHAVVLKPGGEYCPDIHLGIELSDEQLSNTAAGTAWLWFYGCLRYMDFMQETREARFCWRYAKRDERGMFYFASDGDPPTAYTAHFG